MIIIDKQKKCVSSSYGRQMKQQITTKINKDVYLLYKLIM